MPARSPLPADRPLLAIVGAISALALAAVLFIASMPGEERRLMYEGAEVGPTERCTTVDESGEAAPALCAEVGTYETHRTGWQVPTVVLAVVLTALAAVVLATLPRQTRERRRRRQMADEFRTDQPDESAEPDPLSHFHRPKPPGDGPGAV